MLFRFIGSSTRTESQALAPTAVLLLAIILYSGFSIPEQYILGWAVWIRRLNVVSYAYESLLLNELHGRQFNCSQFVPNGPAYDTVNSLSRVCLGVGAIPGSDTIDGSRYLSEAYGFDNKHKWRNVGIIVVFMLFFTACYLIICEVVATARSKGEVLVFPRTKRRVGFIKQPSKDVESHSSGPPVKVPHVGRSTANIARQTSTFHWRDVCYDIEIKNERRRILDHVDGWVKPGTLTALMVSKLFRFLAAQETDESLGCIRSWQNYSSRHSCESHLNGSGHWRYLRGWESTRKLISAEHWICSTTRSPFVYNNGPRGFGV